MGVAHEALKMFLDARKTEKSQGKMPAMKTRIKRRNEPTNTPAAAKGTAPAKKKSKK